MGKALFAQKPHQTDPNVVFAVAPMMTVVACLCWPTRGSRMEEGGGTAPPPTAHQTLLPWRRRRWHWRRTRARIRVRRRQRANPQRAAGCRPPSMRGRYTPRR